MLISVILVCTGESDIAGTLDELARQAGNCEVIVVDVGKANHNPVNLGEYPVKVVSFPEDAVGTPFDAGAMAAKGDVLLFMHPELRLPPNALLAIEHNLKLLPQTIGGNFHQKFAQDSLLAKLLLRLLKWWRYRGSYGGHSGIFVRKEVYRELGGFQADTNLAGYDFVHRLEKYGPTLFLPQAVVTPLPDLRTTLTWLFGPILVKYKT